MKRWQWQTEKVGLIKNNELRGPRQSDKQLISWTFIAV